MKILNELTIKNLLQNKKRTIVTIIGIILSVALMVGIGLLFSSFQYYMIQEVISNKGEYHAIYKDLDGSDIDKVSKINKLKYFYRIPLGYVKINSDNDYKPYMYIEEVNDEFFNQVNLISGSLPKNNHELVISEHMITNGGVSYKIGDKIKLNYGKRVLNEEYIMDNDMGYEDGESLEIIASLEYTIVGIMKRNNYEDYQAPGYLAITVHEGNIDKASLEEETKNYMNEISNSITTDTTLAVNTFMNNLEVLIQGLFASIDNSFKVSEIDTIVNNYLDSYDVKEIISKILCQFSHFSKYLFFYFSFCHNRTHLFTSSYY